MGANLAAIESQEENVYIQQRHNGDKAWIGLNDIATEGLFTWVDGCPDKFRYWAQNQPNNFRGEDCVHTLGAGHGYTWNDVDCSTCHRFTCKKGRYKEVILILYRNCMTAFLITGEKALKQKETKQIIKKKTDKAKATLNTKYNTKKHGNIANAKMLSSSKLTHNYFDYQHTFHATSTTGESFTPEKVF